MPDTRLYCSHPVFPTADVVRAAEFYRDRLGFVFDRFWGDPPSFVMLRRDLIEIFLRGDETGPREFDPRPYPNCASWDVYVRVSDADALAREFEGRGVKILRGPETAFYEMREFEIQDLDGHILCFAHDVTESRPRG